MPDLTPERIEPGHVLWANYKRGEFLDGELVFEEWPNNKGVAINTGPRKHEFVKAMLPHLEGLDLKSMCDDGKTLDRIGAETILEEMYSDSQTKPHVVGAEREGV